MAGTVEGIIAIVQESRFLLIDESGAGHLFLLDPHAAAEPAQLAPLQHRRARVRVRYAAAPGIIGRVARTVDCLDPAAAAPL